MKTAFGKAAERQRGEIHLLWDILLHIGEIPNSGEPIYLRILHTMKSNPKTKKALTFGGLIAAAYRASGKRAKGIVRLAINARLVEFRGPQRFVIY